MKTSQGKPSSGPVRDCSLQILCLFSFYIDKNLRAWWQKQQQLLQWHGWCWRPEVPSFKWCRVNGIRKARACPDLAICNYGPQDSKKYSINTLSLDFGRNRNFNMCTLRFADTPLVLHMSLLLGMVWELPQITFAFFVIFWPRTSLVCTFYVVNYTFFWPPTHP